MIAKLYYIRCDTCGRSCGATRPQASTTEARKNAKRMGWTRVPRRSPSSPGGGSAGADHCPDCAMKS